MKNTLNVTISERKRIRRQHLNEATSTSSSGSFETTKAWQNGGELTTNRSVGIVGVEVGTVMPKEVDITGGSIGGFGDGMSYNNDKNEITVDVTIDSEDPLTLGGFLSDEEDSDFLPGNLTDLLGDYNSEEEDGLSPSKRPKGTRKFRR